MKIKHCISRAALVAITGIALITPAVMASTTITTYNDGDLVLGFRQSGATTDYLVNIGPASNFTTSPVTLNLGAIATDLSAAFGTSWYTSTGSSTVKWSVFGDLAGTPSFPVTFTTLYVGGATSTPAPPGGLSQTFAGTGQSDIDTVTGNYANQNSTANSSVGYLEPIGASNPSNYASWQFGSNSPANSFEVWTNTEAPVNANMYLNVLPANAAGGVTAGAITVPGFFSISSGGVVTYTAVPEPSTFVLLAVGLGLVVLVARQCKQAKKA